MESDIKDYALAKKFNSIPQFRADYEELKKALFSFLQEVEPRNIVDKFPNPFARHLFKGAKDYVVLDFNYTQIVPYSWINGAHGPGVPMMSCWARTRNSDWYTYTTSLHLLSTQTKAISATPALP